MKITIDNRDWREFRLWAVAIRVLLMIIPAVMTGIFEWLFNKSEDLWFWLDRKLPEPEKTK